MDNVKTVKRNHPFMDHKGNLMYPGFGYLKQKTHYLKLCSGVLFKRQYKFFKAIKS